MFSWRRWWNALRAHNVNRDIDRELAFHVSERARELAEQGLNGEEARRQAHLRFGNTRVQAERVHDVDVSFRLEAAGRNVRHSIRSLSRTPGFTVAVVLTLALGIGANSAVFSALDAVLLRPLPFPDADRLVELRQAQDNSPETNIAPIRLEDWNRLNTTFEAITGYYTEDVSDTSGELPVMVKRAFVAPRFHEVWGIGPSLGRSFTAADYESGGASVALVSDRYWRDQLGGDPNAAGRTVRLGRGKLTVIGVMPASFRFPDRGVDLWLPVGLSAELAEVRTATWYLGVGRLKSGLTLNQARANLRAVQHQLADVFPQTDATIGATIAPLKEVAVGSVRASLWLLYGAVSVLLLITCTNVTALLLARAIQRRHETSVRLSLGATRGTLALQMLTESGVLALAGGALGVMAAAGATVAFRQAAGEMPRMDEIQLDWRILLYTLAVTITVALTCGLLPVIRSSRRDAASITNTAERRLVSSRRVSGSWAETADYPRLARRIDDTLTALRGLPGVKAAATSIFLPGVPSPQREVTMTLGEERSLETGVSMAAEGRVVSADYFATMKIPVVAGEPCRSQPIGTASEIMINRAFVDRYLSTRPTTIGLHLGARGQSAPPGRIVGVVGNAREGGLDRSAGPVVYSCFSAPNPTPRFLVRTEGDPAALARIVRARMKELEPLRAVYELAPLDTRISAAFTDSRLRATLLVFFAATALSLAIVGLCGTLSYAVRVRRREIGLRLALGALRVEIVRQFLGQGLRVVVFACLCGLALSFGTARVLARMLYGVSPSDPLTLSAVVAIVLAVAAIAALVPATRAARTEPVTALRED